MSVSACVSLSVGGMTVEGEPVFCKEVRGKYILSTALSRAVLEHT